MSIQQHKNILKDFEEELLVVKDSPLVQEEGIEIQVSRGWDRWSKERIVLLDRYDLATAFEIAGCSPNCCYYWPDYVLHFTALIDTELGRQKVYLRTENWSKDGTEDADFRRLLVIDKEFGEQYNWEKSLARIPQILDFYREQGVNESLLEQIPAKIEEIKARDDASEKAEHYIVLRLFE